MAEGREHGHPLRRALHPLLVAEGGELLHGQIYGSAHYTLIVARTYLSVLYIF